MPVSVINTPESIYESYLLSKKEGRDAELDREARLQRTLGSAGKLAQAYQNYSGNKRDRALLQELGVGSGGGSQPLSSLEKILAESRIGGLVQAPKDAAQARYYDAMAQYVQSGKTNPGVNSILQQAMQTSLPSGVSAIPQIPQLGASSAGPDPQMVAQAQSLGAVGYDTDTGQFVDANGNPVL